MCCAHCPQRASRACGWPFEASCSRTAHPHGFVRTNKHSYTRIYHNNSHAGTYTHLEAQIRSLARKTFRNRQRMPVCETLRATTSRLTNRYHHNRPANGDGNWHLWFNTERVGPLCAFIVICAGKSCLHCLF